jgi:anti-sigma regulatory factor (Ser/Thr protein kinase)
MARLTLPAELGRLKDVCAFVQQGAEAAGLAPEAVGRLDLVVEELFVNIARYAYTPARGEVEVTYTVAGPGRLLVEMSDSGLAFDPLACDPPDFSRGLAERPLGGMGIFLAKSIADSIRYRRDGTLNRISFEFSGA